MEKTIDIRPLKAKLRNDYRAKRLQMPSARKSVLDKKIQNRLMNTWAFRECDLLLSYVSTPIEVDTLYLIQTAIRSGKTVAVPCCHEGVREMGFYRISSTDELLPGSFGVMEPVPAEKNRITSFEGALCTVPAFVFDVEGFRLGYGKGYYDRFLSSFDGGKSVGICYSDGVVRQLPHGKYDKTVDFLVTEKAVIDTKQ